MDGKALVRRLRWVMGMVIVFDILVTYAGQPASYWVNPASAHEANQWVRPVLAQGWRVALAWNCGYVASTFILVSLAPWRVGLTVLFSLIFGHYFGGASWMFFRFHWGAQSFVIYGVILAIMLVSAGFRRMGKGR